MMKVLQITDVHVGRVGQSVYRLDPRARLEACIDDINQHHADAAWCLVTGDLVNEGSDAEYANLKPVLDRLCVPLRVLPGNHDDRNSLRKWFPETPVDDGGFLQSVIDTPDGHIVLLDTLRPGHSGGELCAQRLGWLARTLADTGSRSIHVFLHHPPMAVGIEFMDNIRLRNGDDLWKVLQPHAARVRLIGFGHLHRPVSGLWHGMPFAGCPSTVHQVALELGPQTERHLNFNHEPPCYAVHLLAGDSVVSHQQRYLQNWETIAREH